MKAAAWTAAAASRTASSDMPVFPSLMFEATVPENRCTSWRTG
jgi:hypothetical protein